VRLLPFIAEELVFALKGGTAINLFYRDMPRLSVDIDLAYLPVRDRAESLTEIDETLNRIVAVVSINLPTHRNIYLHGLLFFPALSSGIRSRR
jgi:Nucleotidyl transferase AbiEii toxin, Type IV TA system